MIAQDSSGAKYSIKVGATFVGSTQLAQNLREAIKNLERTATIQTKIKLAGGEEATKTIIKYKDALGQLSERQRIVTDSGKVMSDTIIRTSSAISNAQQQFGVLTKSTETNVSATGRLITRTKEYKDGVLQCVNVTQQWTNSEGKLVTQTQKLNAQGKKIADTIINITDATKKAEQQFGLVHKTTETSISKTGRLVTRVKEYKDGVLQAVTVTQQWKNAQGQLETQIQKLDANGNKLADTIRTTTSEAKKEKEQFGILTTSTETNVSATGRLVTRVKEYKDNVLQSVTVTQQWINSEGKLVTETKVLDAQGNKLDNTIRRIADDTTKTTISINKTVDAMGREVTVTKKLDSAGNGTVQRIYQQRTAKGELITTTETLLVQENKEIEASKRVIVQREQERKSIQNLLGVQGDFIATMGKIIKFQVITKIITGFTTACRNAITVVKEFDSQLTEFKKVSDLSGDSLDAYTKKLGELGTAVARTRTQMVEGATQFKKAGYDDETSAQLSQISALFQNIADSELSAGDSATFIISQMKAFRTELEQLGDEGKQATYVIDSINEVSNNMAVSSTDISIALSKTASAMSALGNNYNETIALVTSGTEIMQGQASKVARGLRSFGNQIAKVATSAGELTFEVQGATKAITLMGADGNLKSTYQVLKEISAEWDNMTSAERQALGISLAGKTQFEVFTSVLNNFADAEKALTLAEEAQGSAWKENARYMESIEARFQALKTAVQNLILGDGGLENLVKKILELSTKFIEFIDNIGGLVVVIGTLTSVLILLNNKAIVSLIYSISKIPTMIGEYVVAISTATTANEVFIATLSVTTLGVGALVLAFTGLVAILYSVATAHDRNVEKIKELNSKVVNEQTEVEQLTKQLSELKNKLFEINNSDKISLTDEKQSRELAIQISQLERELAIKRDILKIDQQRQESKANDLLNEKAFTGGIAGESILANKSSFYKGFGVKEYQDWYDTKGIWGQTEYNPVKKVTGEESFDERFKMYIDNRNALSDLLKTYELYISTIDETDERYDSLKNDTDMMTRYIELYDEQISKMYNDLKDVSVGLDENGEAYQRVQGALDYYGDSLINNQTEEEKEADGLSVLREQVSLVGEEYNLNQEQIDELNDKIQEAVDNRGEEESAYDAGIKVIDEYIDQLESEQAEFDNVKKKMEEWNASMDAFQESYKTLSSAVEEYNSAEGITIDTLQSLLALDPEYLSMLDMENGKLVLNKQALMDKATAQINEARAMVYAEAVEKLKILADKNQKESAENASNSLDTQTDALNRNTQALIENNEKEVLNWTIKAKQNGASLSEIQQVISDMRTQLSLINGVANSVSVNFDNAMATGRDASDKARNSLGKTNSALDKTKQKLEELKQKVQTLKDEVAEYEKVIDYITDKIDEEIDTLEEQRDTEVKAIEDQIDALERLEEEYEDSAKEKINALKEERDALIDTNKLAISELQERQNKEEEYWNAKIQALKDENQALQDQADLQKLLDNLEKARNTKIKVYKKGKGFVWETDQSAVGKAKKDLEEYNRKKDYEKQLAELEKFKKEALDNYEQQINDLKTLNDNLKNQYDKQIEELEKALEEKKKKFKEEKTALEERKKEIEKHYEAEIKVLEDYKKNFEKQVKSYEQEQLRLLTLQKTGIDTEDANWKERLSNLDSFLTEYQKKLKELEDAEKELAEFEKNNSGGGSTSTTNDNPTVTDTTGTPPPNTNNEDGGHAKRKRKVKKTKIVWTVGGNEFGTVTEAQAWIKNQPEMVRKHYSIGQKEVEYYDYEYYAKGTPSIGSNQFAIVGENPNKELVIGSRLNGLGLNLAKGTGVVNAKSTGTLAGLFNMLGGELGKVTTGNYSTNSLSNQSVNNYHIDNISLPQVKDAEDFIKALSNFDNIMAQKAYSF